MSLSLIFAQMMRVISSPSISTIGFAATTLLADDASMEKNQWVAINCVVF